MFERSSEEPEPRTPLQEGDEDGTIDQHAGGDGGNDPTPDDRRPPPP